MSISLTVCLHQSSRVCGPKLQDVTLIFTDLVIGSAPSQQEFPILQNYGINI